RELLLAAGLAPRTVRALRVHADGPGPDELGEGAGVHRLSLRDEEGLAQVRVGELGPQLLGADGLPDEHGDVVGADAPSGQCGPGERQVVAQRPWLPDLTDRKSG